jgi:nitrate/nitrite-specific signal transduction histidine kinase
MTPKVRNAMSFLNISAQEMLALNQSLVDYYIDEVKAVRTTSMIFLIFNLALTLMVLVVGLLLINRTFFRPLSEILDKAQSIAYGDYDKTINYSSNNEIGFLANVLKILFGKFRKASSFVESFKNDEGDLDIFKNNATDPYYRNDSFIKSLIKTRMELVEAREENDYRAWLNKGTAEFEEILRHFSTAPIEDLCQAILEKVVKFFNIQQAYLYVTDRNDITKEINYAELLAGYAYDRKKMYQKKIQEREGLVGQVIHERKAVHLRKIPENYITNRTGLGDSEFNSLLLVPLLFEGQLFGVLELATYRLLEERTTEFIEKICGSIASTINSNQNTTIMRRLLEESQQQAEELRLREEELRQNMEELEATNESILRMKQED